MFKMEIELFADTDNDALSREMYHKLIDYAKNELGLKEMKDLTKEQARPYMDYLGMISE